MPYRFLCQFFVFGLLLITPIQADSIKLLNDKVDAAMKEKNWKSAEARIENFFEALGHRTSKNLNRGTLQFKQGWCEFKQEKWTEASRSFERCYKKYAPKKGTTNPYHNLSLRYWAEAQYHLGNHQQSSKLFMKHFREKPPK